MNFKLKKYPYHLNFLFTEILNNNVIRQLVVSYFIILHLKVN